MSEGGKDNHTEILIIRRGHGDDHAGHKGGAWKIAYADFVTAMMAFFLVMWLINSANEATKARVASYFNPIKMNDASPSGKGLKETQNTKRTENRKMNSDSSTQQGESSDKAGGSSAEAGHSPTAAEEEKMMQSPYAALDAFSTEGAGQPSGRTVEITSQVTGDPFDPRAWEALKQGKAESELASTEKAQPVAEEPGHKKEVEALQSVPESASKTAKKASGTALTKNPEMSDQKKLETEIAESIRKDVEALAAKFEQKLALKVDVRVTDEGILVMLGDGATRGMFEVGSAKPNPALIEVIGVIGALLEKQQGLVTIRGHTDARRFRNSRYDNWQLSTARAHMASYMLIRGGFQEARLKKIEGYGYSEPLDEATPLADSNRRVEFLLQIKKD
jgi:chemotaxis protein MotB